MTKKVDTTALKFNQASLVTLTLTAFLFDLPWLVLAVGVILALGTAFLFEGAETGQAAETQHHSR